ncbi:kip1 ubiquitination-promoting complex subunit 2 [Aphomia sociella]
MTLIGAILKKSKSKESITKKYSSPPPKLKNAYCTRIEREMFWTRQVFINVLITERFSHVRSVVDSSPPTYSPALMIRSLPRYHRHLEQIYYQNVQLLMAIRKTHFMRVSLLQNYFRVEWTAGGGNRRPSSHSSIIKIGWMHSSEARVASAMSLHCDWVRNRRQILHRAQAPFVLFPPVPTQIIEDAAFGPPVGVKRPRVYLTLRIRNCAVLGELTAELFTDACPLTCELFLTLLNGDGFGHGYVGTTFFRKVPSLYWSGGDVIYNSGYGCYAQHGRTVPIGAENYHFSHSIPGLLTMRVTGDNEVCGIFSITFKPLPQFDLKNVVFGRIIRPCNVYESIRELGAPLSVQPVVELASARRRVGRRWVYGLPNTRMPQILK